MNTFEITLGSHSQLKFWPDAEVLEIDALEAAFTTHVPRNTKDGNCFFPGVSVDNERKASGMKYVSLLVYDIDGGQAFDGPDGIDAILTSLGKRCFVYTTFSHGKVETEVKTDHYEKWAAKTGASFPPRSIQEVERYLAQTNKKVFSNVRFDINDRARHFRHDKDGFKYVIHHDPVEMYRVVLPLAFKLPLESLGDSSSQSVAAYKSIYHGVGKALGLNYDQACDDPSRLYYWPSCPHERLALARSWAYGDDDSALFNAFDYPRAELSRKKESGNCRDNLRVTDRAGNNIDLARWWMTNKQFDIESLLENRLPDEMIRATRSTGDGYHIECPFEENHSTTGDLGTFVRNGDGDATWTIYCTHNSCKSAEHGKLEYLAKLIRDGHVTCADLLCKDYAEQSSEDAIKDMAELLAPESDPTTVLDALARHPADPLFDDQILAILVAKSGRTDRTEYRKILTRTLKTMRSDNSSAREQQRSRAKNDNDFPVTATLQLKTMLEEAGVKGAASEDGRALLFDYNSISYTVRDASVFGHRPIVEPVCDPFVVFSGILEGAEMRHLDCDNLSTTLPSLFNPSATDHDHRTDIERIRPDDLAAANLEFLLPMLESLGRDDLIEVFRLNAEYALVEVAGEPRAYTRASCLRHGVKALALTDRRESKLQLRGMRHAKWLLLVDVWLKSLYKVHYNGVGLYPLGLTTDGQSYLSDPMTRRHFNLWQGFNVEARPGSWEAFQDHMLNVLCEGNEAYFGYLLDWMAHRVQRPWEIPGVAVVLFGKKGCGKSLFATMFARLFGNHAEIIDKPAHVVGQFASFAEDKLLLVLEEALFSRDPRHQNATKHMITSNKQMVEKKYEQARSVGCSPGFIFCSNSDEAVHVTPDERRFFALKISDSRIGDAAYFKAILDEMAEGGLEAMLYDLQRRDISNFQPMSSMPYTKHLSAMALRSLEGEDRALLNALKSGRLGQRAWPLEVPLVISTDEACDAFSSTSARRYDSHSDLTSLGRFFEDRCLVRRKIRPTVEGSRSPAFELVSLRRARELMAEHWRVGIDALQFGSYEDHTPSSDVAHEYLCKAAALGGILRSSEVFRSFADAIAKATSFEENIMPDNDDEPQGSQTGS